MAAAHQHTHRAVGHRTRRRVVALVVVAAAAVSMTAAAATTISCGGPSKDTKDATAILGHAPAGIAKSVIDKKTLVVAIDTTYPPGSHLDATTKQPQGFDVDVAGDVAKALGLTPDYVNPNWDLIVAGLKNDRYDTAAGVLDVVPAEQKDLVLTKPYYYVNAQLVVADKATKQTLDGLAGKRIGVAAQSTYQAYLQKLGGVVVVPYADDSAALEGLAGKEVDAVLTDELTARHAVAAGQPIQLSGKPLYYQAAAFAVKKGEADLAALLDHALAGMRADGTLAALSKQWFDVDVTTAPGGVPSFDEAMAALK